LSYLLNLNNKGNFLHVKVTGDNTPENVSGYLSDVLKYCLEHNCHDVLIEENLSGPGLEIFEIFNIASHGAKNALFAIRQIAYVDLNPEHSSKSMDFAETVAGNRGLFVKIFSTVHDAEKWLTDNTTSQSTLF
jgi:hypothetical protein